MLEVSSNRDEDEEYTHNTNLVQPKLWVIEGDIYGILYMYVYVYTYNIV